MNIKKIEGIGPVNAEKLGTRGIMTIEALLKECADSAGRREVARDCDVSEEELLDWVNRADLMRVKGIGEEYSDLLEAAGVDTVKELRRRNANNLYDSILHTNEEQHLVRRPPALSEVVRWIDQANELEPMITH